MLDSVYFYDSKSKLIESFTDEEVRVILCRHSMCSLFICVFGHGDTSAGLNEYFSTNYRIAPSNTHPYFTALALFNALSFSNATVNDARAPTTPGERLL